MGLQAPFEELFKWITRHKDLIQLNGYLSSSLSVMGLKSLQMKSRQDVRFNLTLFGLFFVGGQMYTGSGCQAIKTQKEGVRVDACLSGL